MKAGTGILQAMVDAMDERVKTLADNITCSELEKNMKIVITSWLSKAISKCSTAIATTVMICICYFYGFVVLCLIFVLFVC